MRLNGIIIGSLIALLIAGTVSAQAPIRFNENRGQWPQPVRFMAEMPAMVAWIEDGAILLDVVDLGTQANSCGKAQGPHCRPEVSQHHVVRLQFLNSNTEHCSGELQQRGYFNYYLGNDPHKWAAHVNGYGQVHQQRLYAGIDLRIKGQLGELKYDLILSPGADPRLIAMDYMGADGIALRGDQLEISTSVGTLLERIPLAYQMIDGVQQRVECQYQLSSGTVRFQLGEYDQNKELIIDPTLSFSTYSGSFSNNFGYTATFDDEGFLYSGSSAFGNQYPTTTGAYSVTFSGGNTDIALTKYDTTGTFLVWSTYLGGSGDEVPHSLITNSNDELFVFGTSGSSDFPTTNNAFDQTFNGGPALNLTNGLGINYGNGADIILSRLSSDGAALLASTYVGGTDNDGLNTASMLKFNYADEVRGEVLLNDDEDVYIVTCTASADMPTTPGSYQPVFVGGSHDGIVMKFSDDLSTLEWSTFLGGTASDALYSVDFAPNGDLYVAGGSNSIDMPVTAGVIGSVFNGDADAYVARLSSDGTSLLTGSYWGSPQYDQAYFVELDNLGQVHLFGQTRAPANDLIVNAAYNLPNSGQFISKFTPDLSSVTWSTRFGTGNGTPNISPTAFLVDYCDKIYISGWGSPVQGNLSTTGLEVTPLTAYQPTTTGGDFYLAVFLDDMSALDYATYYGGNISNEHVDGGTSRFDRRGRVYQSVCAGCGGNSDFPIEPAAAVSPTNNSGLCNNAVFKFDFEAPLVIAGFNNPFQVCANDSIPFNNLSYGALSFQWNFGDNTTSTLPSPIHAYAAPGNYVVTLIANNANTCNVSDTTTAIVQVTPAAPMIFAGNDTTFCGPDEDLTLVANSLGTASTFHWSSFPDLSNTLNSTPLDSTATLVVPTPGTYYVQASNGGCTSLDSVVVSFSLISAEISDDAFVCADELAILSLTGIDPGSQIVWTPSTYIVSGQGTAVLNVAPPISTTYTATVTSATGCVWTAQATASVSPVNGAGVSASADPTNIVAGQSTQLLATPTTGVTYSWSPANVVSDPNIADPTSAPSATTTYVVTVSDGVCTRMDSVTVTLYEFNCDEPDIFVPNAFTPNGDGSNDTLYVRGRFLAQLEFRIFDRWGEKMFETNDQRLGWDGTFKDKPVEPAVYVYYLDAFCIDGQKYFKKGNITVIR